MIATLYSFKQDKTIYLSSSRALIRHNSDRIFPLVVASAIIGERRSALVARMGEAPAIFGPALSLFSGVVFMGPFRPTLGLLFLPLLLCGCGPTTEDEPLCIGCVGSFSGADRSTGVRLKQGIELAVDDSASMRVESRRLAVVVADDRGSEETAQAEGVRLLSVNRVAGLIGGADAGRALRLARADQPYNSPLILPCEIAGALPGDAVFTLGVRPAWRGKVLARYASAELKAKHAVVVTDGRNPVAVELAAAFVQEWPRDEGRSVEQDVYQSDADLQERATHAAGAKPDLVLIAAGAPDFLKAGIRLEAGGLHVPLLFGGEDGGAEALAAVRGDVYMATVAAREELTGRGQDFAKRYQERFHEAPDLTAVQGYDAARVLFDAMARAKTAVADRVRKQLAAATDFESLTGPVRFKDGRARRRVFVVSLHAGEVNVVQKIDPEPDDPPVPAQ
jgi:branched-chain amino acid transport system substrate-binding protein